MRKDNRLSTCLPGEPGNEARQYYKELVKSREGVYSRWEVVWYDADPFMVVNTTICVHQVGDLYSTDHCDLNLSLEFWSPVEAPGGGGGGLRGIHHRAPQRQLSLFNFIRLCCDLLPAPLFSPLMHMLTGLCNSEKTAHHGFNFLKANSPSLGTHEKQIM